MSDYEKYCSHSFLILKKNGLKIVKMAIGGIVYIQFMTINVTQKKNTVYGLRIERR